MKRNLSIGAVGVLIALLIVVGVYQYGTDRNTPEQTITIVDNQSVSDVEYGYSLMVSKLRFEGEGKLADKLSGYKVKEPIYKLVTTLGRDIAVDYGTYMEIKKLKCQRFKEVKERKAALEILNEPCN